MISIMEDDSRKVDVTTLAADSVKNFIRDLGFPIFLAILLIYNSWQMQNYLIATNDKRDAQIQMLSEAVRQMADATDEMRKISVENNSILKEMKIDAIIQESRQTKR